jgi:hypothetical protein
MCAYSVGGSTTSRFAQGSKNGQEDKMSRRGSEHPAVTSFFPRSELGVVLALSLDFLGGASSEVAKVPTYP